MRLFARLRNVYAAEKEKADISAAARIIFRFKSLKSLDGICESVIKNCDSIIDALENDRTALQIASLLNIPSKQVRSYSEEILDLLIFNKENNPYMSLGLPGFGPADGVNRRWKRLILLYHPDKYFNQKIYEQRAKRINEAYEQIRSMKRTAVSFETQAVTAVMPKKKSVKKRRIRHFRYLKYIPGLILAAVIIIAILSVLVFWSSLKRDPEQNEGPAPIKITYPG